MAASSERQESILNLLKDKERTSVTDLQASLFYSESSIRRDLKMMEKLGLVVLRRGEVALNRGSHFELPMMTRSSEHKNEKKRIAQYAASFIENGDSVYFDSSSTVVEMMPFLSEKFDLTIVTNGMYTLQQAYNYTEGTFICLGGILRKSNGSSLTGSFSRSNILSTHCDKMFFSSRAVDAGFGLSDTSEDEADVKKAMLENTDRVFFLGDSSKFNTRSIFQICCLDELELIITDSGADISGSCWKPYTDRVRLT